MTANDELSKTFSLIWLDGIVNQSIENIETQQRLRLFINHLQTYQNADQCIEYIKSLPKDRFILIVSGRLGQQVVPHIHHLPQVYSVYVYCLDKQRNEQWAKRYPKIKDVIIKLDELITQIRSNQTKIDEFLPITFSFSNNENNQLDDQQVLMDYLLDSKIIFTDEKEFISLCKDEYKGNENELNIIREFEDNYSADRALWWYTRETFIHHLLNKAFRIQNVDLLLIFRFFIRDIHRLIEDNKCTKSLWVYRSYLMSNEEIELFQNSTGKYLSINGFFLTNLHRQQALVHLNNLDITNNLERILFEITADPNINPNKPFCNVTSFSYLSNEDEILFTLGSIFQLIHIHQQDNGIWIIRLSLSTNQQKLSSEQINFLSFGKTLQKMSKYDQAEKFYRRLLKELPSNHPNLADCHYNLGLITDEKGDYESSIEWHEKSIGIKTQTLKSNDPNLAYSYNSIGNVYQKKGDYKRALEYYHETKNIFGENHPDVAMCLNNMGCIYENEKNYSKAIECHQKSLAIKTIYLSPDHFNSSATHNNLASVYGNLGQLDLALEHFHLSLDIKLKSLPNHHPDIALTLKNIGLIYEIKEDFLQANVFYEKAATIRRFIFSSIHPDVLRIEQDIKRIRTKIKQTIFFSLDKK